MSLMLALAALASGTPTAPAADYYLKIEGVARPAPAGPIYLQVVSSGDVDGDGASERGVVRLTCAGDRLTAAHFHNVKSPRDAASGQATGRAAGGVTLPDSWTKADAALAARSMSWDIKKNDKVRLAAPSSGGWSPLTLSGTDGLCAAASAVINTSRSNVKNQ
jgi:hypothetical protein